MSGDISTVYKKEGKKMTYFNRKDYAFREGDEVEALFNFILPNGDHVDVGDVGTAVVMHADFGKIWGVDFGVNTGFIGDREGFGDAYIIEHVKPRNLHKEEKPDTATDKDAIYSAMVSGGIISAPPQYDFDAFVTAFREQVPAKTGMPKLLAKLGEIAADVDAEERASNEALERGGISIRNKAGVAFKNCAKVVFSWGMEGIAKGGERGLIWFDKAESHWIIS